MTAGYMFSNLKNPIYAVKLIILENEPLKVMFMPFNTGTLQPKSRKTKTTMITLSSQTPMEKLNNY